MKSISTFLVLVLSIWCAYANKPKPMNTSPNGAYLVRVGETEQLGIVYQIVKIDGDQILLQIPSSYQPGLPEMRESAVHNSEAAEAYWSADSHFVAIEELNLNFQGTVIAASVSPTAAELLPIPKQGISRISGERWERFRLSMGDGWGVDGTLKLLIVGRAFIDKVSGEGPILDNIGYDVTLKLTTAFTIISLVSGPDEE